MNKTAIKNFAIWARNKLRADIILKAGLLGITDKDIANPLPQSTNDLQIFDIGTSQPVRLEGKTAIDQRQSLVAAIKAKKLKHAEAFDAVIEEVAYTWFNRLIAVRFMEVNDYLPSRVRVLSSENPAKAEPDFVTTPFDTDLDFTEDEINLIDNLKDNNKSDELFQFLFIKQCNKLNEILPELFEKTNDYTELLLNVSFTEKDGVVYHLVHDISEDDFNIEKQGQVEIIGWLYQYYNTEPKDKVFGRPSGQKIRKEDVPAATQLFTPDWIVRYMVENSLGRILVDSDEWLVGSERIERQKEIAAQMGWKYFLPEAEQSPEVYEQLKNLTTNHSPLTSTFLDPCMGSGHILVYAFDVFMDIYTAQGYTERDAAQRIVEKNLYGLELDDRAAQLAYFAVMMKARSYDRRFFTRGIRPNLCSIQESNGLNEEDLELFGDLEPAARRFVKEYIDAKEYGSILNPNIDKAEFEQVKEKYFEIEQAYYDNVFDTTKRKGLHKLFPALILQTEIMLKKYDVVCTNPPYMGGSGMSAKLSAFVKKYYPDSKADLFAVFMEKCNDYTAQGGYTAMITMHSWMFLSSFEKLRQKLLLQTTVNMAHLGARAFDQIGGEVVQVTTYVNRKNHIKEYLTTYKRLIESNTENAKREAFLTDKFDFTANSDNFSKIPGSPIAYWVSDEFIKTFIKGKVMSNTATPKQGMSTCDVNRFVKHWFEVDIERTNIIDPKNHDNWIMYNKGGDYRKWYGNREYVVYWHKNGNDLKKNNAALRNQDAYFSEFIAWTKISSASTGFRDFDGDFLFDGAGGSLFLHNNEWKQYYLGYLNSSCCSLALSVISPTLNYNESHIGSLPIIVDEMKKKDVDAFVASNVDLSKSDWDSFETSWDFKTHPLIRCINFTKEEVARDKANHIVDMNYIEDAFVNWSNECYLRFEQLKSNEEELNRIFIDIYSLQDELTPEVEDKDVTVRKADLKRDMRSFVSYAVGCMFGRYSLDTEGLAYAGGEFSDEWVVISGKYYLREVVEYYVGKELSRVDHLTEIYGFSDGDLRTCEASAEGGNVCVIRPNEESSRFDSFKYRRGTVKKLYEGIRELFVNSKRIKFGADNTAYDLCSPEILNAISSSDGAELVGRGWSDADNIDWKAIHYALTTNHYSPDEDNCIPITDTAYFEDDIVGRFCEFVKVVYGEDTLEDNLEFVANALGNKGNTSRDIIRNYFLNDFFKDHCKIYQKRPIYWLFDSGKQNGFKALVYMHRWNADTIGNMRVEYLHRIQRTYEKEIEREQDTIDNTTNNRDRAAATKRKEKLQKQLKEAKDYDAKVAHLALSRPDIDLDDGVKVNYEKVQTAQDGKKLQILAKI